MSKFDDIMLSAVNEPRELQGQILDEFQNRHDGKIDVSDPNNTFTFMAEMMSRMVSSTVRGIEHQFDSLYPMRARTSDDLFKHMSNYDYIGLYATPAPVTLTLYIDIGTLKANAEPVEDKPEIQRAIIPERTIFTMGGYTFGIYHPIVIDISDKGIVTTYWDVDPEQPNPLRSLSQGIIQSKSRTIRGVEILSMDIPAYQFARTVYKEAMTTDTGFHGVYDYSDKFYALRLRYKDATGEWQEMNQTMSEEIYNPNIPTATVVVATENSKIKVSIPQVYFSSGLMGSSVEIELYTTKGELDLVIGTITDSTVTYEIPVTEKYSKLFRNVALMRIIIKSAAIVGGSDNSSFDELVERVVNDSFHTSVPITSAELENYINDAGFGVSKFRDGITNRVFHCYKSLVDTSGVPTSAGGLFVRLPVFSEDIVDDKTIIDNGDDSYTLTPDNIYELSTDGSISRSMDKSELFIESIDDINKTTYLFCPYFIRVFDKQRFPLAYAYHLTNPEVTELLFIKENPDTQLRMSINSIDVTFEMLDDDSTNGRYTLSFNTTLQGNDEGFDITNIRALISVPTINNNVIGLLVTPDADGTCVVNLDTDFQITEEHALQLTNFTNEGVIYTSVDLHSTFSVYFIDTSVALPLSNDDIDTNIVSLYSYKKGDTQGQFLNHQDVEFKFGEHVESIHIPMRVRPTSDAYPILDTPVYAEYKAPVYLRDDNGALIWSPTEIADWTFESGEDVYDLNFSADDTKAIVTANSGSDPANIEVGMGIKAATVGAETIPSLLYVTSIVESEGTYTLSFNKDPVITGASFVGVTIGHPTNHLIELTEEQRVGDWIFGDVTITDEITIDDNGDLFVDEEMKDLCIPYLELNDDESLYERKTSPWLCVTSPTGLEPGAVVESVAATATVGKGYSLTLKEGGSLLSGYTLPVSGTDTEDAVFGVPLLRFETGEPDLDASRPDRNMEYDALMPLVSADYLVSQEPDHSSFLIDINSMLKSYTDAVATIRPSLLEYTDLYYRPVLSVGKTSCHTKDATKSELSLTFGVKFILYVAESPSITVAEKTSIRNTVESIIDKHTETGLFSCAEVAVLLKSALSDRVNNVDVGELKDSSGTVMNTQLINPVSNLARPILGRELYIDENNTIRMRRALEIVYVTM